MTIEYTNDDFECSWLRGIMKYSDKKIIVFSPLFKFQTIFMKLRRTTLSLHGYVEYTKDDFECSWLRRIMKYVDKKIIDFSCVFKFQTILIKFQRYSFSTSYQCIQTNAWVCRSRFFHCLYRKVLYVRLSTEHWTSTWICNELPIQLISLTLPIQLISYTFLEVALKANRVTQEEEEQTPEGSIFIQSNGI